MLYMASCLELALGMAIDAAAAEITHIIYGKVETYPVFFFWQEGRVWAL